MSSNSPWEVEQIGKVCVSIVPGRNKPKEFSGSIPWVTTPEITSRYIPGKNQTLYLSDYWINEAGAKKVPSGSVIIACVGDLGLVAIATEEVVLNQQLHAFVCPPSVHNEYCAYALEGQKAYMYKIASTTTIPYLNKTNCESINIPLPPLPEQKAIADLLSTWDEAIEKNERLIDAKQRRFRWLLCSLISDQCSMNDEKAEWKKVKLGEVCKVITSNVDKKTSPDETPVLLCNYMDVYKNFYITKGLDFMSASATDGEIEKYQLRVHDVLLTKDSETPDDIANSACVLDAPETLLCGYHLAILRPKKTLFGPYLNFALHTPRIRYEFSRQANGATRFGLTMSAYNMVELPLPPVNEQKAIAAALTASQHEIDLLKQLAEKYKTQKRGLMQKMLTGEWRVKSVIIDQFANFSEKQQMNNE
ncbi:restriction endonuclease subunit S [Desulfobacter sp.]|uniref:restriction endonuclease subunit S n=1 Tax=Desulfobacter sp. TaxID=2294 RepID=UPI00257A1EDF|nr:restriction endonuclease subunit S [Desulfobacter sp.]